MGLNHKNNIFAFSNLPLDTVEIVTIFLCHSMLKEDKMNRKWAHFIPKVLLDCTGIYLVNYSDRLSEN